MFSQSVEYVLADEDMSDSFAYSGYVMKVGYSSVDITVQIKWHGPNVRCIKDDS